MNTTRKGRRAALLLAVSVLSGSAVAAALIKTADRWYPLVQILQRRHEIERSEKRNAAASAALQQHFKSSPLRVSIHLGDTVEISNSYRYCWFPTVHMFSSGEIMVTIQMSPDERHPEGEFSAITVSRDGGRTWSRRYTLGAGANNNASYTQDRDDVIWSLGNGYDAVEPFPAGQRQTYHLALSRFSQGGMELTQVRNALLELARPAASEFAKMFGIIPKTSRIPGPDVPLVDAWGSIIKGKNGDWLTTVYYKVNNDARSTRVVLARSADQGMTWKETTVIAGVSEGSAPWPWMGLEGPNESAIVRLSDDSLLTVFRTGARLGYTRSFDDGATWSQANPLPFEGVAPRLRLLSNGFLALSFGRPGPVEIAFSPDGKGWGWSRPTVIYRGMSTRYTDFIETLPSRILLVYDSIPYGWNPIPNSGTNVKNTVYGTFVEVTDH